MSKAYGFKSYKFELNRLETVATLGRSELQLAILVVDQSNSNWLHQLIVSWIAELAAKRSGASRS